MWQTEKGILTSAVKHNDRTSVARIFTETHGMVPFIWFISKSGKNASRNTLLQPLTQLEFQADYIPSDTLQHVKDAKNCYPYREIPVRPIKSSVALFLSEFLTHALNGEQSNPGLFRFIMESLRWFDSAPEGTYANFHLAFMLGTAAHLGISPNTHSYRPGQILDMREGCFSDSIPMHSEYLSANLSYKLHILTQTSYDEMQHAPLTGQERVQILNALNTYYRLHVPMFPVLKSIDILETVFS